MSRLFLLFSLLPISLWGTNEPLTPFEKSGKTETATYTEAVSYFETLASRHDEIQLLEYGKTDAGPPLHLVLISSDGNVEPKGDWRFSKNVLLINNAIHAGEPCGVDASMMLARDLIEKPEMRALLEHVTVAIIPVYSIGGTLNRGCCSRANQVGPESYGFRGNAKNLDLNRDFIKCDSKNARAFAEVFNTWLPEVFIDTHTTNGADYPATLTYIPTQPDKAGALIGEYMEDYLIPAVENHMQEKGIRMCPYVNSLGRYPDEKGISAFMDHARYATGYTALFGTMGFITEAHMLKPFAERVEATYEFIHGVMKQMNADQDEISMAVAEHKGFMFDIEFYETDWQLDTTRKQTIPFEGYEAKFKASELTNFDRMYYDRNAPFTKEIPFYKNYTALKRIDAPVAFIIPQAWTEVIELLELNQVQMKTLKKDTLLEVEASYITDYHTLSAPYEGHYFHDDVSVREEKQEIAYFKGDKVVYIFQERSRYIMEVLSPESHDSFFRWNYFDAILGRKEYFSPYLYEEKAADILKNDPELKEEFEKKQAEDEAFTQHWWPQLDFIFQRSPEYERTHMRYPVARWLGGTLPVE